MKELTEENIKDNTFWSSRYCEKLRNRLSNYEQDNKKGSRLKIQECKTCFYLRNGIAGQAFTKYNCQHCGKEQMYHNTAVPNYCVECAKQYNTCVRCGSEMD